MATGRPGRARLNNPTSQAETGDTKIPRALPASTIAAIASGASLLPFASQIRAQVSSKAPFSAPAVFTDEVRPRLREWARRQWEPSGLTRLGSRPSRAESRAIPRPQTLSPRAG